MIFPFSVCITSSYSESYRWFHHAIASDYLKFKFWTHHMADQHCSGSMNLRNLLIENEKPTKKQRFVDNNNSFFFFHNSKLFFFFIHFIWILAPKLYHYIVRFVYTNNVLLPFFVSVFINPWILVKFCECTFWFLKFCYSRLDTWLLLFSVNFLLSSL